MKKPGIPKEVSRTRAPDGREVVVREHPDGGFTVETVVKERPDLDALATACGGRIVHRLAFGENEYGVVAHDSEHPPELLPALKNASECMDTAMALVSAPDTNPTLRTAVLEMIDAMKVVDQLRTNFHSQEIDRVARLIEQGRRWENRAKARSRTTVNDNARSKAEAKVEAEALWNEWMATRPKRTWTNEQFAMEAMHRWKGKFASIAVVVGWIPAWKRARKAKEGGNA